MVAMLFPEEGLESLVVNEHDLVTMAQLDSLLAYREDCFWKGSTSCITELSSLHVDVGTYLDWDEFRDDGGEHDYNCTKGGAMYMGHVEGK